MELHIDNETGRLREVILGLPYPTEVRPHWKRLTTANHTNL